MRVKKLLTDRLLRNACVFASNPSDPSFPMTTYAVMCNALGLLKDKKKKNTRTTVFKPEVALKNAIIIMDEVQSWFDPSYAGEKSRAVRDLFASERVRGVKWLVMGTATPGNSMDEICQILHFITRKRVTESTLAAAAGEVVSYADLSHDLTAFPRMIQAKKTVSKCSAGYQRLLELKLESAIVQLDKYRSANGMYARTGAAKAKVTGKSILNLRSLAQDGNFTDCETRIPSAEQDKLRGYLKRYFWRRLCRM